MGIYDVGVYLPIPIKHNNNTLYCRTTYQKENILQIQIYKAE